MIALALKAWSLAKSPCGRRVLLLIAAVLAVWSYGEIRYAAGVKHERAIWQVAQAKAEAKARKVEKKSDAITAKAEVKHVAAVEKIRTVTQTLIKEVPYAVPSDPARASLSVGFVRLHDAAATGVPGLSDPAGRADAEASGVADADLARTVLANYETCRVNAETVTAWQSWWADQAELRK